MTAFSSSNRSTYKPFDWSILSNPVVAINIIFICLLVAGFAYYIAEVNAVASGRYYISAQRVEISKLTETQSLLSAEKSETENPVSATIFAQSQHMIEAKDIVYVFENNNVALRR
ncbi:MAG: hypothetical protein AAB787_03050 [Patescibacteria group bacterium]